MIESRFWTLFIQQLFSSIPYLFIWSSGIVLSILFRRKNPKKFILTIIPFFIFLISGIINAYFSAFVTDKWFSHNITAVQMGNYTDAFNYCFTVPIWIIGWIILFIAIFNPTLDSIESSFLAKTESN